LFDETRKYYNGKPETITKSPNSIFLIHKHPEYDTHFAGYTWINERDFDSHFSSAPYNVLPEDLPACRKVNLYPFTDGWTDTDFWTLEENTELYFTTRLDTDQNPPKKICLWYRSEIPPDDLAIYRKY